MPSHGSKKQAQRTKGNVRPSSSSQAAQLLSASSSPMGFVGFGAMSGSPGYVPASQALDDMDSTLDPDFRLVLRKLTKKDSTTKIKALQELCVLCKEKDEEALKAVLPFWPRMYNRTALDVDYRVREALQQALAVLVVRVRKQLAPYLKGMMGAWVLSQCDTYPTVSSSANSAFQQAFPPAKQAQALVFCKQEVTEYFIDNLITQTATTLSDPKTTESDDMEKKYQRVVTSSLLGLRQLITSIPASELDTLAESLSNLLSDNKFWKHGKSTSTAVKAAMYTLLASLCQTQASLVTQHAKKVVPFILHNMDEKDPVICPALWESALSLVNFVPECWSSVSVEKAFWPKFRTLLENGFYGNAFLIGSDLLPFISKVPSDILKEDNKFYKEFFNYLKLGLSKDTVQSSLVECCAMVKAFVECCQYVSKTTQDKALLENIILDQLLPVVMASLQDSVSILYKTPLYSMMGTFLSILETKGSNNNQKDIAKSFWCDLGDHSLEKISSFSSDTVKENRELANRCIHLVCCLVYPGTGMKTKSESKVKFGNSLPSDSQTTQTDTARERSSLTDNTANFVQRVTLKCFNMAYANSQPTCLQLFAELIELQPSEETISKVLESCQENVPSNRSQSSYFVFEVCLPWLEKCMISDSAHDIADPNQLVTVICTFVPMLDSDSVQTLLEQLCKIIEDLNIFRHFLAKIINLASKHSCVRPWLQSATFSERIRFIAAQLCDAQEEETNNLQHGWDILSLVLSGDESADIISEDLIQDILHIVHKSLLKLKSSQSPNKADVAVKFVSTATRSFFLQSKSCLLLSSAEDVVIALFSISLQDDLHISEETLSESELTWTCGIGAVVRQTGGLMEENGLLGKAVVAIKDRLEKLETLHQFDLLIQNIKKLLSIIQENLPKTDGEINPSLCAFIQQLCTNQAVVPYQQVLDYVLVAREFAFVSVPVSRGENNPLQSVFYAMCDVKLIHISHECVPESSEGDGVKPDNDPSIILSDSEKMCLMNALHCYTTMEIWVKANTREQTQGVRPLLQRLFTDISALVKKSVDSNCLIINLMDNCQKQGGQLWMEPLKTLFDIICSKSTLTLEFSKLLDRCVDLDESTVQMLQACIKYLEKTDCLTLSEIMVARLISSSVDTVSHVNGGFGALCSLNCSIARVDGEEILELLAAVINQLMDWKDQSDNFMLFGCDLGELESSLILMNVQVIKMLILVIKHIPQHLTDKQWDFIMCSLVSYVQSVTDSSSSLLGSPVIQAFLNTVCDLLVTVVRFIEEKAVTSDTQLPQNLVTEWQEFFSQATFSILLPAYIRIISDLKTRPNDGLDHVLLQSIGNAIACCPKNHILSHELPAYFIAGESSPLPDNLQSLLNHFCPLLVHKDRSVQLTAFHLLSKVMAELPAHDKKTSDELKESEEESVRSPPIALHKILKDSGMAVEIMIADINVDNVLKVEPLTEEYQFALAYLLTWRLLLNIFRNSPAELRQEYAAYYKDKGLILQLMGDVIRLIPDNPTDRARAGQSMFESMPSLSVNAEGNVGEIQHLACCVYSDTLKTMPAIVRQWWREQDRKTSSYIDKFCSKFVSQILCTEEINSINDSRETLDGMTVRIRPTTREVIATYVMEEVSIEMVIALPKNYPLGNIEVTSEKRVGVSAAQWEKWLLQLRIFLQYQNGSLFDGLRIWKRNIDKRFEGVDDCMICYSVLHGTNFQLPKLQCKTCKKKYHSACLYKWFQTSHNSTCPLCRNLF